MQLFLHCLPSPPGMASAPPPCQSGPLVTVDQWEVRVGEASANERPQLVTCNDDMEDGGSQPEPHFPAPDTMRHGSVNKIWASDSATVILRALRSPRLEITSEWGLVIGRHHFGIKSSSIQLASQLARWKQSHDWRGLTQKSLGKPRHPELSLARHENCDNDGDYSSDWTIQSNLRQLTGQV